MTIYIIRSERWPEIDNTECDLPWRKNYCVRVLCFTRILSVKSLFSVIFKRIRGKLAVSRVLREFSTNFVRETFDNFLKFYISFLNLFRITWLVTYHRDWGLPTFAKLARPRPAILLKTHSYSSACPSKILLGTLKWANMLLPHDSFVRVNCEQGCSWQQQLIRPSRTA